MSDTILNHKQQLFIEHIFRGETGTTAAKLAYDTTNDNVAAVIASQNLRKLKIVEAINSLSAKSFNLLESSVQAVGDALNANKYIRGVETDVPDLRMRLKASDRAFRLLCIEEYIK